MEAEEETDDDDDDKLELEIEAEAEVEDDDGDDDDDEDDYEDDYEIEDETMIEVDKDDDDYDFYYEDDEDDDEDEDDMEKYYEPAIKAGSSIVKITRDMIVQRRDCHNEGSVTSPNFVKNIPDFIDPRKVNLNLIDLTCPSVVKLTGEMIVRMNFLDLVACINPENQE